MGDIAEVAVDEVTDTGLGGAREEVRGHPKGLYVLFFTEMWERMSYYGMRSLLTLYMVEYLFLKPDVGAQVFGFAAIKRWLEWLFGPLTITGADGIVSFQPLGSQIYGLYTGLVYFTPFFGGILADRVLGQRRSVVWGGVLMAIGHFLMASEQAFFIALFFLILGVGFLKPNISTQVGSLYAKGDPRRDGAFTIFYMGINLGAFLSPIICGTLGQKVGWHYGFAAAGVGMLLGLVVYLWGQKYLAPDNIMKKVGNAAVAVKEKLTPDEWKRIIAFIIICAFTVIFWGVYEQQGNTLQLWADNNTDWHLLPGVSWELPSTWYQSINPAIIFIFAPVLDAFWRWQARRKKMPTSIAKMAMGCSLLGISFIIMIFAAKTVPGGTKGSVWWLVTSTYILTIGELYLSPIGLSFVTKIAPARMVSTMMGIWFMSSFFGNFLCGYLGTYWERMPKERFFLLLTVLACAAGLGIFAVLKPLKRAIGHGHEERVDV